MTPFDLFVQSPFARALAAALFHFLWQGALIAAVAAIAIRFASRAGIRYAIACLALIAMPVVFALTLWRFMPAGSAAAPAARIVIGLISLPPGDSLPAPRDFTPYLDYAVPLWLAGVLSILAWRAIEWMAALRLRRVGICAAPPAWITRLSELAARAGIRRPLALLESSLAEVPVAIGYLRPAILVPIGMLTGLPAAHVEAILLHELAHLRRADFLVALLQSAIESLLFYHPAVWWISSVIRREREHCCDDFAVALQGSSHAYATALVTLEESRWRPPEPAMAATRGNLRRRVARLLNAPEPREFSLPVIPAALLLIAAVALADRAPDRIDVLPKPPTPPTLSTKPAPLLIAQAQPPSAAQPAPMTPAYQRWLNEEVVYIITDSERAAFRKLSTDQERDQFIDQFWQRRDPTPGTPENEFRDEHYRRIAYANSRFAADSVPGWKTDRGRIYIQYGPPDEIESHPSGGVYQRPPQQGGGTINTHPFEQWRYRFIQGIGDNVIIEFVDLSGKGDFHMTMDPNAKDATLNVPNAGSAALPSVAIQALESGDMRITFPPDYQAQVEVSGRVSNGSGFNIAWFGQTISAGSGEFLAKKLSLPAGSYTLTVTIKNLRTGVTYPQSIRKFEVQ